MSLAVSPDRTHCSVGPRRAQMDATVVPQEPPPRTTTLGSRFSAAMWSAYCRNLTFSSSSRRLARHRCPVGNAAELHRLLDAVEPVIEGVGQVVLPHVPRPRGARLGQLMRL